MLLLLSCSATPGLASVRRDHTTTHLIGLASLLGPGHAAAGGLASDTESAGSPTSPPRLRQRPTVAIRPSASAGGGATIARTRASSAASPFGTTPRSDRTVSLGGPATRGAGARPGPRARYQPPLAGLLSVLHRFEQPATPYAAGHRARPQRTWQCSPSVSVSAVLLVRSRMGMRCRMVIVLGPMRTSLTSSRSTR
jgi:hypothetical protein